MRDTPLPYVFYCIAVQATAHIKRAAALSSRLIIHLIIVHVNDALRANDTFLNLRPSPPQFKLVLCDRSC